MPAGSVNPLLLSRSVPAGSRLQAFDCDKVLHKETLNETGDTELELVQQNPRHNNKIAAIIRGHTCSRPGLFA